jgi:hypothetical protein
LIRMGSAEGSMAMAVSGRLGTGTTDDIGRRTREFLFISRTGTAIAGPIALGSSTASVEMRTKASHEFVDIGWQVAFEGQLYVHGRQT